MHSDILVEILEDYKGLKKGYKLPCFVERNDEAEDGWFFEYAGPEDTEVGFLPRKYGKRIGETNSIATVMGFNQ